MKRFHFRLEPVLGVRRLELEQARQSLAEAERRVAGLDRERSAVVDERRALTEGVETRLGEGLSAPVWRAAAAAVDGLQRRIEQLGGDLRAACEAVRQARAAVATAHTQVRSLERLRERALEDHRNQAARAEQQELDEVGGQAHRQRQAGRVFAALCIVGLLTLVGASGGPVHAAGDDPGSENRSGPTTGAALALLTELRSRELALDRRERMIEEREQVVVDLEDQVVRRIDELEALRELVEGRIAAWEEDNGDTVRRLAKIYAAMPPARAARLIEALDVDLATQIVARMKHKQSAAVLALVSRKRALAMSRQVVHPLRGKPAQVSPAALEDR